MITFGELYSINGRWIPYTSIIVKIGDNSTLAYVEDAYRMYRDYMVYLFDDDRVYLGND